MPLASATLMRCVIRNNRWNYAMLKVRKPKYMIQYVTIVHVSCVSVRPVLSIQSTLQLDRNVALVSGAVTEQGQPRNGSPGVRICLDWHLYQVKCR